MSQETGERVPVINQLLQRLQELKQWQEKQEVDLVKRQDTQSNTMQTDHQRLRSAFKEKLKDINGTIELSSGNCSDNSADEGYTMEGIKPLSYDDQGQDVHSLSFDEHPINRRIVQPFRNGINSELDVGTLNYDDHPGNRRSSLPLHGIHSEPSNSNSGSGGNSESSPLHQGQKQDLFNDNFLSPITPNMEEGIIKGNKKKFDVIVQEMLEKEIEDEQEPSNQSKPKPKRPFLKKGAGLLRYPMAQYKNNAKLKKSTSISSLTTATSTKMSGVSEQQNRPKSAGNSHAVQFKPPDSQLVSDSRLLTGRQLAISDCRLLTGSQLATQARGSQLTKDKRQPVTNVEPPSPYQNLIRKMASVPVSNKEPTSDDVDIAITSHNWSQAFENDLKGLVSHSLPNSSSDNSTLIGTEEQLGAFECLEEAAKNASFSSSSSKILKLVEKSIPNIPKHMVNVNYKEDEDRQSPNTIYTLPYGTDYWSDDEEYNTTLKAQFDGPTVKSHANRVRFAEDTPVQYNYTAEESCFNDSMDDIEPTMQTRFSDYTDEIHPTIHTDRSDYNDEIHSPIRTGFSDYDNEIHPTIHPPIFADFSDFIEDLHPRDKLIDAEMWTDSEDDGLLLGTNGNQIEQMIPETSDKYVRNNQKVGPTPAPKSAVKPAAVMTKGILQRDVRKPLKSGTNIRPANFKTPKPTTNIRPKSAPVIVKSKAKQPVKLNKKAKSVPNLSPSDVDENNPESLEFKQILLHSRVVELEHEIDVYKAENQKVINLRHEQEGLVFTLKKERDEFEKQSIEQANKAKEYLEHEKEKLKKDKLVFEKYVKEMKANRQEREEVNLLNAKITQLQEEILRKESRWTAAQTRLRDRVKELEIENQELRRDVVQLRKEINEKRKTVLPSAIPTNKQNGSLAPKAPPNGNLPPKGPTNGSLPPKAPPKGPFKTGTSKKTATKKIVADTTTQQPTVPTKQTERAKLYEKYYGVKLNQYEDEKSVSGSTLCPDSLEQSTESQHSTENEYAQVLPDTNNRQEINLPNGDKEVMYSNGSRKIISDGGDTIKVMYFNGDIKITETGGSVKYFYSETQTWHITYPTGLEVLEFPDGQVESHRCDGIVEVKYATGAVKLIRPDGSDDCIFPDGSKVKTDGNGTKTIVMPNGQKETHTKHYKKREYPDGTVKIIYPDGQQETRYATGRIRIKDQTGKLLLDSSQHSQE